MRPLLPKLPSRLPSVFRRTAPPWYAAGASTMPTATILPSACTATARAWSRLLPPWSNAASCTPGRAPPGLNVVSRVRSGFSRAIAKSSLPALEARFATPATMILPFGSTAAQRMRELGSVGCADSGIERTGAPPGQRSSWPSRETRAPMPAAVAYSLSPKTSRRLSGCSAKAKLEPRGNPANSLKTKAPVALGP